MFPEKNKTVNIKIAFQIMSTTGEKSWATHLFGAAPQQSNTISSNDVAAPLVKGTSYSYGYMVALMNGRPYHEITDKSVALEMLSSTPANIPSDLWDRLHYDLQNDREVALQAIKVQCIPTNPEIWPKELQCDREFWKSLLTCHQWKGDLPFELVDDIAFMRSIPHWNSEEQIETILHLNPVLAHDLSFWFAVVRSNITSVSDLLFANTHPLLENKEIMTVAVQTNYHIYFELYAPLNQDVDIVTAALQQSADAIRYIPRFIQLLYPDQVANAIRNWQLDGIDNPVWSEYVDEEVWAQRDVALAWVSIGGGYRWDFPRDFRNDEEIFLSIAQHNWSEFSNASRQLLCNKVFMRKAVELNGILLLDAMDDLNHDLELGTIAFSNTENMMDYYDYDFDVGEMQFLGKLAQYLESKVDAYTGFRLMLLAIYSSSQDKESCMDLNNEVVILHQSEASSGCTLSLLNQGRETTKVYTQLIQEYIGVPIVGIELKQIRTAQISLRRRN
jgi:hypothetical protein